MVVMQSLQPALVSAAATDFTPESLIQMPIFTYTPEWEQIRAWYARFERLVPEGYDGLIGIRLHRTGHPLTFEILGETPPDKPYYPVLLLKLKDGKLERDWHAIEVDFDIPWLKQEDFELYRDDVMSFYHTEDALEVDAEKILDSEEPLEELLRQSLVDHSAVSF